MSYLQRSLRPFSTASSGVSSRGSLLRRTGLVAGVGMLGAGSYLYATDDGIRRAVLYYKFCLPRFVHYKYVEYKTKNLSDDEIQEAFQTLHDKYSPQAEVVCLDLKGYYLKSAQLLSTMDDFIPEPYLTWCKKLQNEVPSEMDDAAVRQVIEKNFGCAMESIFEEFCFKPVGVASIGQVYKATLREPVFDEATGEMFKTVAVKVQTPGIEHRFRADLTTIKSFCSFAMPHFVPPLDEIEKQFKTEFDFILEANNLETVHANVTPVYGDRVKIPKPVTSLSSRNVLVMEFLEGEKFLDAIKKNFQKVATLQGRSYEDLEKEQLLKIENKEFVSLEEQKKNLKYYQRFLNLKMFFQNVCIKAYNQSVGLFLGKMEEKEVFELINLASVIETVALVHGHEIMVDGAVNGDPHPGNILLLTDGRLGLVDYGQTKHLDDDFRYAYAELILALCAEDKEKVFRIARDKFKIETKHGKIDVGYRAMKFWNDNNSNEVRQGLNVYQFLEMIEKEDPIIQQSEDLIIPSRVNIILRGMGNAFGIELSMAQLWKPIAEQVLQEGISKGYQES